VGFHEQTKDQKFTAARAASANWFMRLAVDPTSGIILDGLSGTNCDRGPPSFKFPCNSGKFIEGLRVLADVTDDDQWRQVDS
jgi:hypothetical protein